MVAVVLLGVASVRWYFVEYTPTLLYGNPNAVVATALGHYARDRLGPDWRIHLFGAPRLYAGFGSIPYLARGVEGTDVTAPLTGPPRRPWSGQTAAPPSSSSPSAQRDSTWCARPSPGVAGDGAVAAAEVTPSISFTGCPGPCSPVRRDRGVGPPPPGGSRQRGPGGAEEQPRGTSRAGSGS